MPAQTCHDGTAIGSQQADCHKLLAVLQLRHLRLLQEIGPGRCLFLQLPEAIQIRSSEQKRTRQHGASNGDLPWCLGVEELEMSLPVTRCGAYVT